METKTYMSEDVRKKVDKFIKSLGPITAEDKAKNTVSVDDKEKQK